jgi:hypothetical protein
VQLLYKHELCDIVRTMILKQRSYKIHKKSLLLTLILIFGVAYLVLFINKTTVHADNTTNYPWIRPDNWLSQSIKKPSGGVTQGHIGVDVQLTKSGSSYNPCHNVSDSFVAACESPGGYYKVHRYTPSSSDFPYGIFIDNSNSGANHFWARRLRTVFLEIYPYSVSVGSPFSGYRLDPGACGCSVVGGFQLVVNDWKGGYSADIGTIRAASFSDPDVGKLNGFVRRSGSTVQQGEVNIDWFGEQTSKSRSSTSYPVYSFASWPTNNSGYYTSGPVLKGTYHIYVKDKGPGQAGPLRTVECVGVPVKSQHDRIDLQLNALHFGLDGPGRQCFDR